jgi:hypothetical protein
MNAPFDRLHADLADLADEVRMVDLRDRAVRSSRRLAVRRTMVATAAAVAVVAIGAGTAFAVLPGRHAALPVTGPSAQASPTAAPTTEAPSAAASEVPAAPSTSPPASGSAVPATSRCHTGDLQVTVQYQPDGGAMGQLYRRLVFTNSSTRTCTLYGFPGVSWVTGPDGQQVNDPATRSHNVTPSQVTLSPGQAAGALVHTAQPGMFPDTCKPVTVAGFRVYPPDETAAIFVPAPDQQCSTNGVNVADVSPVSPLPSQ